MGVLVIGAHRSGTSALAGALEATGLFVGPSHGLIAALPENPDGFFELQAVADLNDEILHHLGGTWDSPPPLPSGWMADPTLVTFVHRATDLVESSFGGRQFLLKDPRMALLLPIWRRALLDRCCAVLIVRDPVAVAWSLTLRNGLSTFTGLALWSTYYRQALEGLSGLPVQVCNYAELVESPASVLSSITQSLHDWGELPDELDVDQAAARIKPSLRRDTWPRSQMELVDPPADVLALESFLAQRGGRHDCLELGDIPDGGGWEYALLEERRIRGTQSRLSEDLRAELSTLRQERSRLEAMVGRLQADADAARNELESTRQALQESQRTHGTLELEMRDRDQLIREIQDSEVFRATYPLRWAVGRTQRLRASVARQRAAKRLPTRLQISAAFSRVRLLRSGAVTTEAMNRDGAIIQRSGIFDAGFYAHRYPESKSKSGDPLQHYLRYGARKGYWPHPLFDPVYYTNQLKPSESLGNPLAHYLRNPGRASADPHPLFDGQFYRLSYLKDEASDVDPFLHYLSVGGPAGNSPNRAFDVSGYTFEHPEVRHYGNALQHYVELGRDAGFSPHPLFESDWYLSSYPEVAQAGLDAYEHFLRKGLPEGKLGSRALNGNPDIKGPFPVPTGGPSPKVTVIIPTYDSYFDTYRCLTSVSRTSADYNSFRVMLVDDCPDNPVGSLLVDHPGLEITTNETNYGFLRTCNKAAASARTEYIMFLNNDTVVTVDWLSSLVSLAGRMRNAGLVGSKLLNFDGTIQDAGGMILQNGWGYPISRGRDRAVHEANYVREVDCVVGACMLVLRSAFERLGGFDERYAPAFYEEFDLAFRLREAGYRVLYQPKSEVYHLGSSSYGAETRDALSDRNHAQFVAKWSRTLADHCDKADLNFKGRVRGCPAGTILVIEDRVPEYDKHAGAVTMTQYLHLLVDEGFRVILWPDNRAASSPYTDELQQAGIEVAYGDESFTEWLQSAGPWIDFVLLARPYTAILYLDQLRRHTTAKLLYYTHDLHFLREQRRYDIEGDSDALRESLQLKEIETRIFNTVDCVCTPSAEEEPVIRQLASSVEIAVLPPYFYDAEPIGRGLYSTLTTNKEILFVGGYGHPPNVDAAMVLVNQVMPLIWQEVPDARVTVVGSNPPHEVLQLAGPRVDVIGFARDLDPLYTRARMTVNPLRYGAGVKGKIVESLRHGIPVVTTPIGAEGIGLSNGRDALVGETARELADHAILLFKDPERLNALAAAGSRTIGARFSRDLAREAITRAIGVQVCAVCGNTSTATQRGDDRSCARCSAVDQTDALARVIFEPYRCLTISCLNDAISGFADSTIHGAGLGLPLIEALSSVPGFSTSDTVAEFSPERSDRDNGRYALVNSEREDESLDLSISQDAFEPFPDTKKILSEIFRTLKAGGRYISLTRPVPSSESGQPPTVGPTPSGTNAELRAGSPVTEFRVDLIELLVETGFEVLLHEPVPDGATAARPTVVEARRPMQGNAS